MFNLESQRKERKGEEDKMGKIKNEISNIKGIIKDKAEEKASERKQIKESMKEIRKKSIQAGLEEREKQSIRYAKEKQRIFADRKIKALSQPKQPLFNIQPSQPQQNKSQESMGDFIMRI